MTKAAWTRAPALFFFFMVVGIAEYFVVMRLHGYLWIEAVPVSTEARSFVAVSGGERRKETPEQVGGGRTGVNRVRGGESSRDKGQTEKVDDDRVLREFLDDNCKRCTFKERMDRLYDIYNAHGMYSLKDTRKHYHGEPEYERDYVNVPLEPPVEPEVLVEKMNVSEKTKTPPGKAGWNILLSLRTTVSNHRTRLPLLFDTWLTKVNTSQVFLVTDGEDPVLRLLTRIKGMNYVNAKCGNSYLREQLCCKAGVEFALMFQEQNKAFDWLCHVDDDMYVNMSNLVPLLSRFDPKTEPIYLGRSGSAWRTPRRVKKKAGLSLPGMKYHFAVGGMYCLSRAMLHKTMQWIVGGEAFSKSCSLTKEPEDVTVGFIVAMHNYSLSRTERINTHGLHLASTVKSSSLSHQVAISYGYGAVKWGKDPYNAVKVPHPQFPLEEDESQFRSFHCFLYPATSWCGYHRQLLQSLNISV